MNDAILCAGRTSRERIPLHPGGSPQNRHAWPGLEKPAAPRSDVDSSLPWSLSQGTSEPTLRSWAVIGATRPSSPPRPATTHRAPGPTKIAWSAGLPWRPVLVIQSEHGVRHEWRCRSFQERPAKEQWAIATALLAKASRRSYMARLVWDWGLPSFLGGQPIFSS